MNRLALSRVIREQLGESGSEALLDTFAAAHALSSESFDRTVRDMEQRFERRLEGLEGHLRQDIGGLKFELLKWSFLFWVAQVAAVAGILSVLLRHG
jgi:hypothetical protein